MLVLEASAWSDHLARARDQADSRPQCLSEVDRIGGDPGDHQPWQVSESLNNYPSFTSSPGARTAIRRTPKEFRLNASCSPIKPRPTCTIPLSS